MSATTLLVGTRKGAWTIGSDEARHAWTCSEPMFLGHVIQHVVADPRDGSAHERVTRSRSTAAKSRRSVTNTVELQTLSSPLPAVMSPSRFIAKLKPCGSPVRRCCSQAAAEHAIEELLVAVRQLGADDRPDGPNVASGRGLFGSVVRVVFRDLTLRALFA